MSTITRSADHVYTYKGKEYPGVTSILDVIDKSGPLMTWAARQTAEAAVEMYPDALGSLIATVGEAGAIKALSSRSTWKRDEAANIGTVVHHHADRLVSGHPMPPNLSDVVRKRVEHYAEWWQASGWTLYTSEAMLIAPRAGYGGTLDLLAKDKEGCTVLADIKTGGKWGRKVYESEILQLTAYGMAEFIQPASDNVMVPATAYIMPKVDRHVILHVAAEGVHEIEVHVGVAEQIAWFAAIELAAWRDSVKGKQR